ncbi:MAG: hypothetical protein ACT4QE_01675 [Anaerolineales bacterium]
MGTEETYEAYALASDFIFWTESGIRLETEDVTGDNIDEALITLINGRNFRPFYSFQIFDLSNVPPKKILETDWLGDSKRAVSENGHLPVEIGLKDTSG